MRKNFGTKSWFYPLPVLVIGTYDENGYPDAMNAAIWASTSAACGRWTGPSTHGAACTMQTR